MAPILRSPATTASGLALALLALLMLPGCRTELPEPPLSVVAVPPALMSWRVASAHLEDIFETIPNSSIDDFRKELPEGERMAINASHGEEGLKEDKAYIYGEPAPASTDLILKRLGVREDDVIYDLGCGRGYFLMQALLTTPARKAVGVELAASRIAIGRQALGKLQDQGLMPAGKELELREQDMAQTGLDDATLVYMDSVFYSDQLLASVARHMARAPRLRAVVMIMKGLPPNPWFELEATERWKMSWSPKFGSEVLFFRRTAAPAPAD